ncbi:MAG: DNA-directed DNA polymerase [Nanoarchaeota archaeon]
MDEKLQFFPIDFSYKIIADKAVINIFGRTSDGRQVLVQDNFEPYFYVVPKNDSVKEKLEKIKIEKSDQNVAEVTRVEKVSRKFQGKDVDALMVFTKSPSDIPVIKEVIEDWEIIEIILEYDMLFLRRYLIDKTIIPMTLTEATGHFITDKSIMFKAEDVRPLSDETLKPKILAINVETYDPINNNPAEDPIVIISFYANAFHQIITWKKYETNEDVIFVDSEIELLEQFKKAIEKFKPDIITGYNSDKLDLPRIESRARKYNIKLELGPDPSKISVNKQASVITARISGIVHLDIAKYIAKIKHFDNLREAASELLDEPITQINEARLKNLWDLDSQLDQYMISSLRKSRLIYLLTEKLYPTIMEMVKIVGQSMFDVNRMGFSQLVELYLLKNAKSYNELAPNGPTPAEIKKRRIQSFKGAFVFAPKPGLYKNIAVFDFRSLYPSIISSHNISPGTLSCECCKDKNARAEAKYYFCSQKKGFIPIVMEDLIKRRIRVRDIIKEENNVLLDARLLSLKLLANAFYGYMGFYGARWYNVDCARAITAYGRQYIMQVIEEAKNAGFGIVYSDTDSVFLTVAGKSINDVNKFLEDTNVKLPGVMELEFEGMYKLGIFVPIKDSQIGAKKKYALLLNNGTLKIRGFEAVRRNSSLIVKEVQSNILNIILKENNTNKAITYLKMVINELKDRKIPNEKVIIHTQLQKAIKNYDSVGPHVAVALKMKNKGLNVLPGDIIQYIVKPGSELIRDRSYMPDDVKQGEYDPDYYVNNQVVPAVENIFEVLGYSKEELVQSKGQKKLGKFLD